LLERGISSVIIGMCSVWIVWVGVPGVHGTVSLQCICSYNTFVHREQKISWLSRSWCRCGM